MSEGVRLRIEVGVDGEAEEEGVVGGAIEVERVRAMVVEVMRIQERVYTRRCRRREED